MPTIRVDTLHRFKNYFSSYGRGVNGLYRNLDKDGCHYLLERELPDKSRVLLAYQNKNSLRAKYAFKLNTDGTMIQKKTEKSMIMGMYNDTICATSKIFTDKEGYKNKEIIRKVRYNTNQGVIDKYINKQTEKYFSEYKYHQYGEKHIHHNRVYPDVEESFVKISTDGKGNDYTYIKNTDGTKTFIKNINGINYTFTNAK